MPDSITISTTLPEWLIRELEAVQALAEPTSSAEVSFRHRVPVGMSYRAHKGPPIVAAGREVSAHGGR